MADSTRIPAGALAPYALRYWLRSERFDLSKVDSARFALRRANGSGAVEYWTATVSDRQTRKVLLTHAFDAAASEVPSEDRIVFEPRVTLSTGGGELVGATRTLVVFAHPSRL